MIKTALLIVSLFCLTPPVTGVGIAGLIAWGLLTLLFRTADEGVEQMATEIQDGNQGNGGCWLTLVFVFVIVGGVAVLSVFGSVAGNLRGAF